MSYVDGFVIPVSKSKFDAYRAMAKKAAKIWMEHGALEYHEAVADDAPVGKRTSFPRSVKLKTGEVVIYSWILYKSRAHRDRVLAAVMKDKRMGQMMEAMKQSPSFDGKRMIYGGFKVFLSA